MKPLGYLLGVCFIMALLGVAYDYYTPRSSPLPYASQAAGGEPVPPLALQDIAGKAFRLEDIKTPYILVNFWATWCAPCKEEIPLLAALADTHGKTLTLVAVSVDAAPVDIGRFLQQFDATTRKRLAAANVRIVRDPEQTVARDFQVYRYPETYLIGPERTLQQKITGRLQPNDLWLPH